MTSNEQSSPLKSSPMEIVTAPHGCVEIGKEEATMLGARNGLGLDVGFQAVPLGYTSMRW